MEKSRWEKETVGSEAKIETDMKKKMDNTKKFHKETKLHSIIEIFMTGLKNRNSTCQKSKVLSMYSYKILPTQRRQRQRGRQLREKMNDRGKENKHPPCEILLGPKEVLRN